MGIRYAVTHLIRLVYIWAMEKIFPNSILSLRFNTFANRHCGYVSVGTPKETMP
jgi:hypothetical protein